jgi:integrase
MAKGLNRLSPKFVEKVRNPGRYHDGRGLYLQVAGGKSWLGRYQSGGKTHWLGYGPYPEISLARAREKNEEARRLRAEGIDPLAAKRAQRTAEKEAAAKAAAAAITFRAAAEATIAAKQAEWRNPKHASQWPTTLAQYAYPVIGHLPVSGIETGHVTQILQPIWADKTATASRLRGRIEAVLDFAKTHGWRTGENPARWKGHLQNVLASPAKANRGNHHAALPWREIGGFMAELMKQPGIGALALRFAILSAARAAEVLGAQWSEIDLKETVWTVPADRMKAEREHRIPLSGAALEVLHEVAKLGTTGFVFPGQRRQGHPAAMLMWNVLRRMGRDDLTVHGFRATFRTWCGDTGKPGDIAEIALAHTQGKLHDAYQRADLLERRRKLMDQWAEWCSKPQAEGENVIALAKAVG